MMHLSVENLRFGYSSKPILKGVQIDGIGAGEVAAIIGPNAAGKSTLFKCLAGILKGTGNIFYDGRSIEAFRREEITKHVTYLPQEGASTAVLTVFEAILLARQFSVSWRVSDQDLVTVTETMEALEISDLALRYLNELSGGQRQMVSIAQALVREPDVLLMDEPTNSLDLQRQLEVLSIVRRTTKAKGITTLIALHDLNLASRYADQFVVMSNGMVYASGRAESVLTPQMLEDIYGVHAEVSIDSHGQTVVTPMCSARNRVVNRQPEYAQLAV